MKRFIIFLLVVLLAAFPLNALCESEFSSRILNQLDYASKELDLQAWLDGPVADAAGESMDNYVIILQHAKHNLNLDAYLAAAAKQVLPGAIKSPVSRQRCALTLIAGGRSDLVPDTLVDETAGKLGVMSYVYALHLLNNGAHSDLWTIESIVDKLLSMQKRDGGWAAMGNFSDVDATAMCMQALACVNGNEAIEEALNRAIALLSERQLESGGFSSNGKENAESAAQIIIALSSLGIDADADERFIQNDVSVLDALLAYQLHSGGFAHLPGESENETAGIQALQAFVALNQAGTPYYDFSNEPSFEIAESRKIDLPVWKIYALAAAGVFLLLGAVYALTRKHGKLKQLIFVILLASIAAAVVLMIEIESTAGYYSADDKLVPVGDVYLSIRCDTVAGFADNESTPEDGTILDRTAIPCSAGDSVFDILTYAAKKYEIHMEHEGGAGDMAYVNGINYLYEYDYGDLSGWMYRLNDDKPSVGCGAQTVKPDDEIIWEYTTKLGEDLK